jgi:hypothetical protein
MADIDDRSQHALPGTTAQALIVDGLPPCTIAVAADGAWYVLAQLAADEQAALAAAAPDPATLCQRAQHALGLAGIGSRIAPDHSAIGVYAAPLRSPSGAATLVLEGRAVLWSVSRAPSEAIRALIAAATSAMHSAPDS